MVHFHEVQQFRQWWLWPLLLLPTALFGYGVYEQIFRGRPCGTRPMPDRGLLLAFAVTLFLPLWFRLLRLVTEVHDYELHVQFVGMWRRRVIPLGQIRRLEVRTYRPLLEYGGWGIRWGPSGQAYNVSGDRGVQLELVNGKRLLIGSQRPEELAAILEERRRAL